MPIVSVKVIQDFFTKEQKTALITGLTDAFCKATLEAIRPYIYVTVEEVPQGMWGLAGHPLPDPDFLINDLVPLFEHAADVFSQVYGVPRRAPRGPGRPPSSGAGAPTQSRPETQS
jgi:4-oxalocrotonate tautomerase family enzyme